MAFNTNRTTKPKAQVALIAVPERGLSSYVTPNSPIPNSAVSTPMAKPNG